MDHHELNWAGGQSLGEKTGWVDLCELYWVGGKSQRGKTGWVDHQEINWYLANHFEEKLGEWTIMR